MKDYYQILNISPQAGPDEIKQAYRRLAMQYHPDKNAEDPYADVQFKEVKEAYEVLTDPVRRDAYLRQRWLHHSQAPRQAAERPVTPPGILLQCLELERHVSTLDQFRLNRESLFADIMNLLSDTHIDTLHRFAETETNREIIRALLPAAQTLSLRHFRDILRQMEKLAGEDPTALPIIRKALHREKKKHFWERYKTVFAILLASLLCWFIYRWAG